METKYLYDGAVVELVQVLDCGYLIRDCYDYEDESFSGDRVYFVAKLYDSPPTVKYTDEIMKLKERITELVKEINLLRKERTRIQGEIAHMKQPKIFIGFDK